VLHSPACEHSTAESCGYANEGAQQEGEPKACWPFAMVLPESGMALVDQVCHPIRNAEASHDEHCGNEGCVGGKIVQAKEF
jgi:hypothetical protein